MSKIIPVILDYGIGNVYSLKKAIERCGYVSELTSKISIIDKATHIFLPGVGAFEKAIHELKKRGLYEFLKKSKEKKILGICLGMQILFEKSFEMGSHEGLGLIKGTVEKISFKNKQNYLEFKTPNIGWFKTEIKKSQKNDPILTNIKYFDYYFVHSYHAKLAQKKNLVSYTRLGDCLIPAIVREKNIYGCQFHPEKSRDQGINIIKNFLEKI